MGLPFGEEMWSYYGAGLHNDTIYHDEYSKILTINELLFIIKLTELKWLIAAERLYNTDRLRAVPLNLVRRASEKTASKWKKKRKKLAPRENRGREGARYTSTYTSSVETGNRPRLKLTIKAYLGLNSYFTHSIGHINDINEVKLWRTTTGGSKIKVVEGYYWAFVRGMEKWP